MRVPLRIDNQGIIRLQFRTREAITPVHTISPGETFLDIPYDTWAAHAPGVVEIKCGKLHRAPFPDPEFLQYLEENLKE